MFRVTFGMSPSMETCISFVREGRGSAAGSAQALQNGRSSAYRFSYKSAKSQVSDPNLGLRCCACGRGGVSPHGEG